MKLAVSSYSFQQYFDRGEITPEGVIEKAAQMGFDAIEFVNFNLPENMTEEYAGKLLALASEKGVEICAYLTGSNLIREDENEREEATKEVCRGIDIAKMLGVKLFRYDISYSLPKGMCFERALEIILPQMRKIADYGEKYGILTMIENHGQAFVDCDRLETIFAKIAHKNFGLILDIGNFMCADADNVKCVAKLSNLASHVHLKDMKKIDFYDDAVKENGFRTRECNYLLGKAVGDGDARAAQCIEIFKSAGFDGYMSIEYEGTEDCVDGIKRGLSFVKNLI